MNCDMGDRFIKDVYRNNCVLIKCAQNHSIVTLQVIMNAWSDVIDVLIMVIVVTMLLQGLVWGVVVCIQAYMGMVCVRFLCCCSSERCLSVLCLNVPCCLPYPFRQFCLQSWQSCKAVWSKPLIKAHISIHSDMTHTHTLTIHSHRSLCVRCSDMFLVSFSVSIHINRLEHARHRTSPSLSTWNRKELYFSTRVARGVTQSSESLGSQFVQQTVSCVNTQTHMDRERTAAVVDCVCAISMWMRP